MCFRTGLKTFPEITNKETERGGRKTMKVDQRPESLRLNKGNYGTHKKKKKMEGNQGNNFSEMKKINSQFMSYPAQKIGIRRNIRNGMTF